MTGTPEESEMQHRMAGRLDALGMDTDLWRVDLPSTLLDPGFPGSEAPRDEAWGLVGSWGGGDGPTVVLNGHLDVVPTGDPAGWSRSPWSGDVHDGRVHGRGACDMKGGVAAQLLAVQVLREAGVRLRGTVQVQSVIGEEDGGLGTFATLRRGYRGDLAVVCEPTSGNVVPSCAGALTFRLTVPGRAVHASVRTSGVDAFDKYVLVHEALRRLETTRNVSPDPLMSRYDIAYPISVGTVRAGNWVTSVPDLLIAEGRLGVALGEPVERARQEFEAAVGRVCAGDEWLVRHPVRVEWFGGQFASGEGDRDGLLGGLVSRAHAALNDGQVPERHGAPYGSDLRLLHGIGGVPTVHYGPGDVRRAHMADEYVPVNELVTVCRTLVLLVAGVCGES